jgi:hypothetical protein
MGLNGRNVSCTCDAARMPVADISPLTECDLQQHFTQRPYFVLHAAGSQIAEWDLFTSATGACFLFSSKISMVSQESQIRFRWAKL